MVDKMSVELSSVAKEAGINSVVCNDLCLGCGTCVSVCPQEAVKMIETPSGLLTAYADASKCKGCGLCLKCCPGTHLEQGLLLGEVDPFKGGAVAAYLGQALDQKILSEGQSGGVITALLCYLLESGRIKGAVVTQMPENGSLRSKTIVSRDKETVCKAQGSKYCPVAVNAVIPKSLDDGEKIAVVGLPCHIHGIRNVQSQLGRWQGLFAIGLICQNTLGFGAIDHLIYEVGVDRANVQYFRFRSKLFGGWPGDVYIRTRDGAVYKVANRQRMLIKDVYTPLRCRLCFDKLNVLSDLAVGDPWGIRNDDKEGFSVIIARTNRAKDVLLSAESAGWLRLESVEPEVVFKGQKVERKRQDWAAYTEAWRQMSGIVPEFCIDNRWIADAQDTKMKPYRRKLEWAQSMSRKSSVSEVLKAARRKLAFQKLRWNLTPKRWTGFLSRCFARLKGRSPQSAM
jgi:coenzyme F420 hydrogenase subunit beta